MIINAQYNAVAAGGNSDLNLDDVEEFLRTIEAEQRGE